MKIKYFSTIVFLFLCLSAVSQNPDGNNFNSYYTDYYANIVPQTPNAANFTQYGNIPVNASTGLPSISIPIYTIEEDGVQVPISLTYNASGIRVDDVSSTVGLKWTLNAGGMVSRTINDLDDFKTGIGWLAAGNTSFFDQWLDSNPNYDYHDKFNRQDLESYISDHDNFPDDFNYNFLNYSGSFIFSPNNSLVFGDYTDNLREGIWASDEFEFDDLYGNTFQFSNYLETNKADTYFYTEGQDTFVHPRSQPNTVGWMLDKITTKNGKEIDFDYIDYAFDDESHYSQRLVTAFGYECGLDFPYGSEYEGSVYIKKDRIKATRIFSHTVNQLIRHIYANNVEVEFVYTDGAVNGITVSGWDKRIDKIIVKDLFYNKQKEFHFKYGTYSGDPRLKLLEVREKGFEGELKPPYVFNYDTRNLPQVGSFAKDYKGYYNGRNTNNSLLPKTESSLERKDTYYMGGNDPLIIHPGYDLLSDKYFYEPYLKAGVLTDINYPTGGKTEFTYEPNAIGENLQEPLIIESTFSFSNDNYEHEGTYTGFNEYVYGYLVEIKNFKGRMNLSLSINSDCPDCMCNCPEIPKVDIYEYFPDQDIYEEIIYDSQHIGESVATESFKGAGKSDSFEFTPSPNTDIYIVMLKLGGSGTHYIPPPDPNAHHLYATLSWNQTEKDGNGETVFQKHYFGGLRIKEIKDIDEAGNSYNLTKYNYLEGFTDNPFESYKCLRTLAGQDIFTSEPQWEPGTQITSGYYYTRVNIEKIDENYYGKTEEYYIPKYTFYNVSGGELYKKKVYDKEQKLLSMDSIGFVTSDPSDFRFEYSIPPAQNTELDIPHDCENFPGTTIKGVWPKAVYDVNLSTIQHYSGRWRLPESNWSTQFLKHGNYLEPVTMVKNYDYNDNLLITKETTDTRYTADIDTNGDITGYSIADPGGKVIETDYKYTDDPSISPPLAPIPVGLPVSKEVFNDTTKILGQYFEYDGDGNIKNTYRYNKGGGSHSGGPGYVPQDYELDVSYLTVQGKPTQVRRQDGVVTSYIWGYNGQYPVAKVENATYAQAIGVPGLNMSAIDDPASAQDILDEIDKIRIGLPNAQVTTYTYKPLIGVNAVVDPKGYKTTYYYDGFGRLQYVKDQDGNVLSENQYHYKN